MVRKATPRKPKTHNLKIYENFADAKLRGIKLFEIRDTLDRDFAVGDKVRYKVLSDDGTHFIKHELSNLLFEITYITDFMQRHNYIVFGEKLVECNSLEGGE